MDFFKDRRGLIVLGIALVLAYVAFKRKNHKQPKVDLASTSTTAVESNKTQVLSNEEPPPPSPQQSATHRKQYNAMMSTGLREIPSSAVGDKLKIKMRMALNPLGCSLGEFDLMKGMVQSLNEKLFLLSIEPLFGSKEPAYRQRLSLGDFFSPTSLDVALPYPAKTKDYGIYLCIDKKNSNSCGSMAALGAKEWNEALNHQSNRILYFQAMTLNSGRAFLLPSHDWRADTVKKLKKTLEPIIEKPETIDTMRSLLEKLSPIPAGIEKGILEIPLSHRRSKC